MRNVDRLEQQRQMRQRKRELPPPDEETEEEMEQPRFVPLNKRKNAFDAGADRTFGGINTAPSVFAKTAVFPDWNT